jgi:peptidoglycan/xylan/chitin deacetylase (PgdA/CDA1 family)
MARAAGFVLLFVLTNSSLLLLYPFSLGRLALVGVLFGGGTAVMLVLLFDPGSRFLLDHQTDVPCLNGPCVALSFDDGPSPEITPKVLDILRQKDARATFFLVGEKVERHPDLARQMAREGHVIGNHTYSHPSLFCFLSPRRLREEIELAQEAIGRVTGATPRHFRSPVGLRHPLLEPALRRATLELVLWRLRTYDTLSPKPEALRQRVLGRVRPGAIVLLHDRSGPGASAMLAALPDVIDGLRARGYQLVTV